MSTAAPSAAAVHAALALGGVAAAGAALVQATGGSVALGVPASLAAVALMKRSLTLAPVIVAAVGLILLVPGPALPQRRAPLVANDLILAAGSLAFLAGLSGLARRDADPDARLPRTAATVAAAVLAAQAAVYLVSRYDLDWRSRDLLVAARRGAVGGLSGRAIVACALLALSVGVGGFVLWYARQAAQTPDQARATLLDTAWTESRRELSRQALFRARFRAPRTKLPWRKLLTLLLLWLLLALLTGIVVVRFVPL